MSTVSKLRAPLLAACVLLARSDRCVGSTIRLTLTLDDEPDAARRIESLVAHLAGEHGLAWRIRGGERVVRVYLTLAPTDAQDGVDTSRDESSDTSKPSPLRELAKEPDEISAGRR